MFGALDKQSLIMELLRRKRMQQMMAGSQIPGDLMNMTVGQLIALLTGSRPGMLPPPVALPGVGMPGVGLPDVVAGPPGLVVDEPGPVEPDPLDPGHTVN